ncbi:sensor histidine kinase [Clostridium luticellarii]|jgi:LytS/YehU family sensor histidine kinase|uniref:histidine kinase n=1 Tax=Clostridium luticellarii TaxID=1691940 RepID=A0A2T0BM68_9CLOT|nr:PocR ligand-binding domain-containing protein [Clostridium luticellarii]MCI1945030.1 PocR ligand-binding domain-containing protein [Clostridium luticellarii]MCI1967571.1 PocR ligand-binding domain-containing protein [Clostridium luticellarii]MCI1995731.1 PocR ligand-binding domain-containing protein [Clostridium luticellarii]MCI2040069.1 PocR ligand-binding domain-containing protein [Clostridium luticellarii]PRR84968.1 Sensor histidine kinase YehU [Clostridium luticellarii]
MYNIEQYKLDEIIDANSLQDIQDKYSKLTNLSTITVDRHGVPVIKPSNFSKYCSLIRTSKEGYRRCITCDAMGGLQSSKLKKPIIYRCHAGLTDFSAPIVVNDIHFGSMLCGQVIVKENNTRDSIDLEKISSELYLPLDKLKSALNEINIVEYEKVKNSADFMYMFANLIAKMGVANIAHSKLLEETKEKMKFQQLARDIQIKSIQAQINPHFLFNTLNTMASMSLLENSSNTVDLIYALSDILRYSLRNSDKMVNISTEIKNIEKYLYIQNVRFRDKLDYKIDVSSDVMDCKIPAMTLQPIIENAVIHGIEPKKQPGKVSIISKIVSEKYIAFKIEDNGVGMNPEKLQSLKDKINSSGEDDSNINIGIQIVQDRIKYYFGSQYGIDIKSSPNEGTTVYIKIPLVF